VKQLLFMMAILATAGIGGVLHPFWPLAAYYGLAILRPQYLWAWALPDGVRWSMIVAAMVFGSVLLHIARTPIMQRGSAGLALVVAFAAWIGVSTVAAHDPAIAQAQLTEYAKILIMTVLATLFLDRVWQIWMLGLMMLGVTALLAWDVNTQYLFNGRLDIFHYGIGGLDNNGGAVFLAMGAPFALVAALRAPQIWMKAGGALTAMALTHGVMLSYSRGGMLSLIPGVAWVLLQQRDRKQAALALVIGIGAAMLLAGPEIRDEFASSANFRQDVTAQTRFDSWGAAMDMIIERPLLGHGPRNSTTFIENYGADLHGRAVHNQYLQLAADSGQPALLIYLALLALVMWNLYRCRQAIETRHFGSRRSAPSSARGRERSLTRAGDTLLACEASLIVFACSGVFLSLELFEFAWILIAIGITAPRLVFPAVEQSRALAAEVSDRREAPAPARSASTAPASQPAPRPHAPAAGHARAPGRRWSQLATGGR